MYLGAHALTVDTELEHGPVGHESVSLLQLLKPHLQREPSSHIHIIANCPRHVARKVRSRSRRNLVAQIEKVEPHRGAHIARGHDLGDVHEAQGHIDSHPSYAHSERFRFWIIQHMRVADQSTLRTRSFEYLVIE